MTGQTHHQFCRLRCRYRRHCAPVIHAWDEYRSKYGRPCANELNFDRYGCVFRWAGEPFDRLPKIEVNGE